MDVLSASFADNKIAWYENDGNENFTPHTITTSAYGTVSVYAVDVDGDGDVDVLSASVTDDKIAWYENLSIVGIDDERAGLPTEFTLSQNHPNPFNPLTTIEYSTPRSGDVSLIIFNLLGEEVAKLVDEAIPPGRHTVFWNASNLPSGIYFYRLQAGDFVLTRKMVLLK